MVCRVREMFMGTAAQVSGCLDYRPIPPFAYPPPPRTGSSAMPLRYAGTLAPAARTRWTGRHSTLGQHRGQLIEGSAEAFLQSSVHILERCDLLLRRAVWGGAQAYRGLAGAFGEGRIIEDLKRYRRLERSPRNAASRIREGIQPANPLPRCDLAIQEPPPPLRAVGEPHAVVEEAARPQLQVGHLDGAALRAPPRLELVGFCPRLPGQRERSIEDAGDDEGGVRGRRDLTCRHLSVLSVSLLEPI